jgi:xylulokinase
LQQEYAEMAGLSPHTAVILGCGDEHAASLGAGVISSGLVCDITGTAEPVCAASREPLFDHTGLVETHCHADPDLWLLENPGFVSGGNYRWLRDQFAPDQVIKASQLGLDPYDLLNQEAEAVPPGSDGLVMLPCLSGAVTPTWNALARGVFSGFTLAHRRAHFVRAVLEASAYALRDITDRMQAMGLALKQVRAVGGGARSPLWRQIKADVTGLPVTLLQTVETTALGAGLLALVGRGYARTPYEAVKASVRVVETRDPDPNTSERYQAYYQLYRATYFALQPVFEKASGIIP